MLTGTLSAAARWGGEGRGTHAPRVGGASGAPDRSGGRSGAAHRGEDSGGDASGGPTESSRDWQTPEDPRRKPRDDRRRKEVNDDIKAVFDHDALLVLDSFG